MVTLLIVVVIGCTKRYSADFHVFHLSILLKVIGVEVGRGTVKR